MIITIAILAFIGMLFSVFDNAYNKETLDVNLIFPSIIVVDLWNTNLALAIVTIIVTVVIGIIGAITRN